MILVIGAGVAGISSALAAVAAGAQVRLVTPGTLRGADALAGGNTALAQGGVAAAIGPGDSVEQHLRDTIAAGSGLVDAEAAAVLTSEGATAVQGLLDRGFAADRDASGELSLGLEGAHGRHRIVHAGGDRTGAVLHEFLVAQAFDAVRTGRLEIVERHCIERLLTDSGVVVGAVLRGIDSSHAERHRADAVVLATGGYAALFPRTSNHAGARGEGIVLAAQAGAVTADLEFVQFHPTVLHAPAIAGGSPDARAQLISEAVRGAGAVLRDASGERFMLGRHPMGELASRDIVSREIHRVLRERGDAAVWLDATGIEAERGPGALARLFPAIDAAITAHGFDWRREPVPVVPAAHYTMGGVASDLDGRTSVPGLFVAGEVASTGVHGANRLASNSLLEGLVFGRRSGAAAAGYASGVGAASAWRLRGSGMRALVQDTRVVAISGEDPSRSPLLDMIAAAAEARTESRGAHQSDAYPETDQAQAERRAFRFLVPARAAATSPEPRIETRSMLQQQSHLRMQTDTVHPDRRASADLTLTN